MSKFSDATFYLAPSGYRESILYPQKPLSSIGHLSFTRASSATRTNAAGQIEQVCYNLFQYSEAFDNSGWTKANATISANTTNAPNSFQTADSLIENSALSTHLILQSVTLSAATYTYSVYVKAISGSSRNVGILFNTTGKGVLINPSNGTVVSYFNTTAADVTVVSVLDGWFRISVTATTAAITESIRIYLGSGTTWTAPYQGDGTSGVFIWGAQLVQGTLLRDYLYTTDRLNFPRVDFSDGFASFLLEPQRTNSIRNSTMVGANTSPSTIPTNWTISLGGLTATVVGVGTENGLPYIDIQFTGTATATSVNINFESTTQITASNGQTWTSSFWIKEISASAPPISYRNAITERDSVGGSLVSGTQTITISSTLARNAFTRTNTNASTARIGNSLSMTLSVGNSYDFTVRVAAPQLELGAFATTFIPTSTVSVTRLADTFSTSNIFTNNLISSSGGTWFVELRGNLSLTRDSSDVGLFIGNSSNGTSGDVLAIRNNGTGRLSITKRISGTQTGLYGTTTDTTKIAIKWNGSTADVFVNGTKQVSATSFTATNMEFLNGSGEDVTKFIQQMALWNTPLSDSQCTELTV